jgi:hypothetical protein
MARRSFLTSSPPTPTEEEEGPSLKSRRQPPPRLVRRLALDLASPRGDGDDPPKDMRLRLALIGGLIRKKGPRSDGGKEDPVRGFGQ